MADPKRHVVVDTNLLIYFLHPNSADTKTVRDRCEYLFGAALDASWSGLRLYVPAISVAEAIGVLDKYRFCTWAGPVKQDPAKRLNSQDYRRARSVLADAIRTGRLEQLDHEPSHVSLASLISPVNQMYQYRRRRTGKGKVKKPMGGADCLIAGISILLQRRLQEEVILATADQRLADVMAKCAGLSVSRAEALEMKQPAEAMGIEWGPNAFPKSINVRDASISEMRDTFLGWPLPTVPCQARERSGLTDADRDALVASWLRIAGRHGFSNPDRLAHASSLLELRTDLAATASLDMTCRDIFLEIIRLRKSKSLPKP